MKQKVIAYINQKIEQSQLNQYPYQWTLIDDFLPQDFLQDLVKDLEKVEQEKADKLFDTEWGQKKEYFFNKPNLISFNTLLEILGNYQNPLSEKLCQKFNLPIKLYGDVTFDGGGYVISPKNSFLKYHKDFNWSSKAEKYRILNLILYLNPLYKSGNGGNLHLLDNISSTVEVAIEPKFNRAVLFVTNLSTPHGVSRNLGEFERKSFNCYFYSDEVVFGEDTTPHKTIWLTS